MVFLFPVPSGERAGKSSAKSGNLRGVHADGKLGGCSRDRAKPDQAESGNLDDARAIRHTLRLAHAIRVNPNR